MAHTTIKDIYSKDISQKVKGVIMAEQADEETIYTELEEFVITKELHRHIKRFFESYNDVSENKKDTIGVWISGFFGSGKSHLLKILSYLLENKAVKGKTPLEFFAEKLRDDQLLLGDVTRAVSKKNIDIMLFNIDSRAGKNSKNQKDGILEVFVKVFNEKLGYCSDIPWLADFEHTLFMRDELEHFKKNFHEISGQDWNAIKDNFYFERENIINALTKGGVMKEGDANAWFDADGRDYNMSVSKFAGIIRKYSEKRGSDHKIVFLVDEIGQYIGDNSSLMLNLQTLVEDLGKELSGKAWVIVTSQEAIDKITEIKGKDFSKIQGRFPTKLMLSSENTDEVVKKRLLEKTKEASEYLEAYYIKNETIIKNLFSFSSNTAEMKLFKNGTDFSGTYPFVPYQFNLLQKVFEKIRITGVAGSHIADGNRSMLNGYQEAGSAILDKEIGTLVPFSAFYNTIETFISSEIKRTISNAGDNGMLQPIDVEVLKVLFMIRYIDELPCDLENVTTLLVSHVDEDKQELRNSVKSSFERLLSQTLIHKNGDLYLFLTNEEQDINKQIGSEEVDKSELLKYVGDVVFNEFFKPKKYAHSPSNNYFFNQFIDDYGYDFTRQYGIVLKISTSLSDGHGEALFYSRDYALGEIRINDDDELLKNLSNLKKIEKWLRKNNDSNFSKNIRTIVNDKSKEIDEIKARIRKLLEEAIKNGTIYINGKVAGDIKTNVGVATVFTEILRRLVESVYTSVDWITKHYETDEIAKLLKSNHIEEQSLLSVEDNKHAIEEVKTHILTQSQRSLKTPFKAIIDKYTAVPYGWNETDIAGVVAHLFVTGDVQLKFNEETLSKNNPNVIEYLTKTREFERLIVSSRKQTDKKLLLSVKTIIQEIFDRTDLPDNEDDLFSKVQTIFKEEIQKLESLSKKHLVQKYPVRMNFELTLDTIQKFYKIPDAPTFFDYIVGQKDELETYEKNVRTIFHFFDSQILIFDDAVSKLSFYDGETRLLLDEEKRMIDMEKLEEVRSIVKSSNPYSKIKDIPLFMNEVKSGYEAILKNKRESARQKLDEALKLLQTECEKNAFSESFVSSLISGFNAIRSTIELTESCSGLGALSSNITDKVKSANAAITWEINRMVDEKKASAPESPLAPHSSVPQPKKQVSVEIDDLVRRGVTLRSQAEIDQYTGELNRLLKNQLNADIDLRII